jgi:UDP-2,3-diacylglucosamine hydrolase
MAEKNCIFFASDLHLGMHPLEESRERERWFVDWLEEIRSQARELWLLGDIFDYWFEYRKVVPRGFTRFLGKLAQLSDEGVEIHVFTGNHDVWFFDYLPAETGVTIHQENTFRTWNGQRFLLGHGDGLLGSDFGYRFLQSIFRNRILQWLYARIHPNGSMAFAQWWSKKSRLKKGAYVPFLGTEKEHQVIFARKMLKQDPGINHFVFGHRHVPFQIRLSETSQVLCLGDWIENFTYAVFDGEKLELRKYFEDRGEIITS